MTPIEKAARALAAHESGTDCYDALDEGLQAGLQESVRVVLAAFREPSAAMIAAYNAHDLPFVESGYQAMIDAALSE